MCRRGWGRRTRGGASSLPWRGCGCWTQCCSARRSCSPKAFAGMLAAAAAGNPGWAAAPVLWAAHLAGRGPALANAGFATVQLLIALAIAGRPTVKAGLAASAGWALAVWWLGEGLGGVLTGGASPVTGAPGAAVLYALLAVLLWPGGRARQQEPPFVAAGSAGVLTTQLAWLALWGSLAC